MIKWAPRVSRLPRPRGLSAGGAPRGQHGGSALVEGPPSGWRQRWGGPATAPPLPGPVSPRPYILSSSPLLSSLACQPTVWAGPRSLMVVPACGFLVAPAFTASWLLSFKDEESSDSRCVRGV